MVDFLMALRRGSVPHRRACTAVDARRDRQKVHWCLASGMAPPKVSPVAQWMG